MSWRTFFRDEIKQLHEEGYASEKAGERLKKARISSEADAARLMADFRRIKRRPDYGYRETTEHADLLRGLKAAEKMAVPGEKELAERLHGAWVGRAAGCMLGKPVEMWSAPKIRNALVRAKAWPLSDYFPSRHFAPIIEKWPDLARCLRGNITCAVRDDDMDYTVLGLRIIEQYGRKFTSVDVGKAWLARLAYATTFTAERAAYGNLVRGLNPPKTAQFMNPWREWIGAQIRADFWGYVNPGDPARAAEYAMRDALVSHTKNGVYGEMWVAAALAAALAGADMRGVLRAGLAVIPENSRLAEAIRNTAWWCQTSRGWEEALGHIRHTYGRYGPVHTINNACIVVMALLFGVGDFGKTVSIAVMGGWDTDCNGATAGSIAGAMLGAKGIPAKWSAPLNDTLVCGLAGEGKLPISGLAARTVELALAR
jgi:ADP-ribosylglycohydrolase